MIGQRKLQEILSKYSLVNLPQTIMFIGAKGCGKHLMSNELAKRFNLPLVDITSNLTLEYINDIYVKALPAFYFIDMTCVNERQQNVMLKFIEEPIKSSYIILSCVNKSSLLPTIINRCVAFEFEPYSVEELSQFIKLEDTNRDKLLLVCETPGMILNTNSQTIDTLFTLCDTIVDKIQLANFSNTLSISNKINYKDSYDKLDPMMFITHLGRVIFAKYKETSKGTLKKLYNIVWEHRNLLMDSRHNKEYIIEHMLIEMWEESRSEC